MKKNVKSKCLIVILMVIALAFGLQNNVYASISMSSSSVNVEAGKSTTVNMIANNTTGDVNITSSNPEVATATGANNISDNSIPITITGKSAGTATITISGMAKDTDTGANKAKYSRTINVKVTGDAVADTTSADLSNLGIKPNDFSGFSPNKTSYDVTVPENVQTIEVYATAKNASAKISGTGTQELAIGENKIDVVVSASDGTTKTYTINVKREGENKEEVSQTTEKVEEGLSELKVENLELTPKFTTNVYEYSTKYIGEKTTLDIQAIVTEPTYTAEIVGNEDLKEGENVVTILVSDKDGKNIATYQININKSKIDEEAIAKQEEERKQQEQKKLLLIGGIAGGVILLIIIILIIKHQKSKSYAEEFSAIPFSKLNDKEDEEYFDNKNENINDIDSGFENNSIKNDDNNEEQEEFKQEDSGNIEEVKTTSKEELKRKFLEGYNTNFDDDYKEEKVKKNKHKGKRFK